MQIVSRFPIQCYMNTNNIWAEVSESTGSGVGHVSWNSSHKRTIHTNLQEKRWNSSNYIGDAIFFWVNPPFEIVIFWLCVQLRLLHRTNSPSYVFHYEFKLVLLISRTNSLRCTFTVFIRSVKNVSRQMEMKITRFTEKFLSSFHWACSPKRD